MWILTRSRRRQGRPLCLGQSQARRSPSRADHFGDGGLVQRQSGRLLHVTWSGVTGALGQLGTLPQCTVASVWHCRPVSLSFTPIEFVLMGCHIWPDFIGSGVSTLLQEWWLTNDYKRFALLATAPFLFCVSLVCTMFFYYRVIASHLGVGQQFFSLQVITNISYV